MNYQRLLMAALLAAPGLTKADLSVGIRLGVPIREAPPAPLVEHVGRPPRSDYIWINGHWAWNGRWTWLPGRWERVHTGSTWQAGHWEQRGDGYVWIEGQWIPQAAYGPQYAPQGGYVQTDVAPPDPYYGNTVVVQDAPPPPIAESYGPAPGPDYFWVSGHWGWHNRWQWEQGHWEPRHAGSQWESGRWEHRNNGNIWIEGRWRGDRDDHRRDRDEERRDRDDDRRDHRR